MNFEITNMALEHIPRIAELENENSHFIVAVSDDVMGYIGVQEICGEAYITNIAVFGEYRNQGIGRSLLKKAVDGAKSRNCEFITLEVRESNESAISLYKSEGFEVAGVRKSFYTDPTENGIIYTKYFNE